jgi:trehalose 6-phosphate synthase
MNLVAKEYIAAQDANDPGVLILSRFAGAAAECRAALLVNPFDSESVARAMKQALEMPLSERRDRYNQIIARLDAGQQRGMGSKIPLITGTIRAGGEWHKVLAAHCPMMVSAQPA